MDLTQVARVLAGFAAVFTAVQVVPAAMALGEPQGGVQPLAGFLWSIGLGLLAAGILWLAGRGASRIIYRKEAIAVASLSWVLAGLLGAIPFRWSGLMPDGIDALFESVSGLATCGGTVLGTAGLPTPEQTPHSLLLWRALLHWMGGIGIVLLFASLLGAAGSRHLFAMESVGVETGKDQRSASALAHTVIMVYVALTVACIVCLLLAGMDLFESVCQAFATIATGGFSTRSSIAEFHSLAVEIVLTVFMFLGGCSFLAIAAMVRSGLRAENSLLRSPEFRIYAVFTALAVTIVAASLTVAGLGPGTALRAAAFNVISIIACCGFATWDFQAWPALAITVLITCAIVGGSSGSAAGGFKQIRLLVCLKLLTYTLRTFVRPRSVERLKLGGEVLPAAVVSSVVAVVLWWLLGVLVGTFVLACDDRIGFLGALSTSASMQAGAGPAIAPIDPASVAAALAAPGVVATTYGPNIGPLCGYGELYWWQKLWMCFQMIFGRLELLTLLAFLSPSLWRR